MNDEDTAVHIRDPHLDAPQSDMTPRDPATIRYFVIHHTAGPVDQTVADIDREHRNQGWAMIGYNYVVDGEGNVWSGRPENVVPAATAGLNGTSIAAVVTGNFQPGSDGYTGGPSEAQLGALTQLAVYLHMKYPQIDSTIGHRDAAGIENNPGNATACPGDDVYAHLDEIKQAVRQSVRDRAAES